MGRGVKMIDVSWSFFKDWAIQNKKLNFQAILDTSNVYNLIAADGSISVRTRIEKKAQGFEDADQLDYELNFSQLANKKIDFAVDNDGAQLVNPKLAGDNTGYLATFFNFRTSDIDSLDSQAWDGSQTGLATIKLYDIVGKELSQANKDQAVCTVLNVAQTKKFYIQGFTIQQKTQPDVDAVLSAAFAPHIPKEYGGCKEVIQGCNLRYAPYGSREIDWVGDSTTGIDVDLDYFSHIMGLKIVHPPGFSHQLQCEVIWYV
jgi:hypothetical protein